VSSIIERILSVPGTLVYVIVGLLVFAEDALFIGFVIPGETAAVLGGVDASRGHVQLPLMIALVVAAAIIGDSVGYEIGRQAGLSILRLPVLARHQRRLDDAQDFLARRGGSAVFLGRFVAFFRAVMPALAGTARMPYRRFLVFNAAGGAVWGAGFVLLGYLAGNSYATVERNVGRTAALAVLALVLLAVLIWRLRKRRSERQAERAAEGPPPDPPRPGKMPEPRPLGRS
jgi:membrane protein DedA with SNARE-associated domain